MLGFVVAQPFPNPAQQSGQIDNFDKYQRVKELGRGNFGTAFLIIDKANGKELVYKKIQCHTSKEEDELRKETIIMNDLKHPNIVGLIEAFTHDGNFYIVMELCNGGSLQSFYKALMKKGEFVREEDVWKFIFQMASSLGYLHQRRILH
ncbi:MAG: putative serine/threonine-protein kinase Nek1, partial [Streblomastix strix]